MFEYTLYTPRGIRASLSFRRPCTEPDSILGVEECLLLSVGDGLDGKKGRAHGGFNSLMLDHISGAAAYNVRPDPIPPATATITVDFKAPIATPCVVLCRGWVIETSGRKIWVKGLIEGEGGSVCASSRSLFISARPTEMATGEKL
jgi:acyl-coenzyme A thioesterase PaaI-like protein